MLVASGLAFADEQCTYQDFSAETLRILQLEGEEKEEAMEERRRNIAAVLSEGFVSLICTSVKRAEYAGYTNLVDAVKTRVSRDVFSDLSPVELAYFVDCGEGQNPFFKNLRPDGTAPKGVTADGFSETTLKLINSMGPLLLEKGPNGKTSLQYVESIYEHTKKYSPEKIQGVYGSILDEIHFVLNSIVSEKTRTDGTACWNVE